MESISPFLVELTTRGSRLKLAEGWTLRVVELDKDLVLTPDNGVA